MEQSDVLIVGAGPTGLVLALWLTKAGVKVRIIDKTAGPGTTSRALAVQARTLELYRQLDLTDAVVARGHRVPAANFWIGGERKARISLDGIGKGATPYPFLHIFPQDEHEKLLIERLEALGVSVERRTELVSFAEKEGGITAQIDLKFLVDHASSPNQLVTVKGRLLLTRKPSGGWQIFGYHLSRSAVAAKGASR